MRGTSWLVVVVVSVFALAASACKAPNPHRCPDGEFCPPDARGDDRCGELTCRAPTPVCETTTTTCVECTENEDCAASRPVCSAQRTCVQCQVHGDCAESGLCLLGGTCADRGDVAYVGGANASSNTICSIDMPCQNLAQALMTVMSRRYVKVTGAIVHNAVTTIDDKNANIYGGPGAKLSRSSNDQVLIIKGSSKVALIDLEIVGNTSSGDKSCVEISEAAEVTMTRVDLHGHGKAGVSLSGTGKLVLSESRVRDHALDGLRVTGGNLEIRRSSIHGNKGTAGVYTTTTGLVTIESSVIAANTGSAGGVSILGPFSIRNSIISGNGNGTATSSAGGLTLNPLVAEDATFEFNTVADNASGNLTTGIWCLIPFGVSSSILTNNTVLGCDVTYSLTDLTGTPTATNRVGNPMFVTKTLLDPMFFRIGEQSEARDGADPAATLDVDIDGDPRPAMGKDMGADEYR